MWTLLSGSCPHESSPLEKREGGKRGVGGRIKKGRVGVEVDGKEREGEGWRRGTTEVNKDKNGREKGGSKSGEEGGERGRDNFTNIASQVPCSCSTCLTSDLFIHNEVQSIGS